MINHNYQLSITMIIVIIIIIIVIIMTMMMVIIRDLYEGAKLQPSTE